MTKKIISALFLAIGAFFYQVDAQVSNLGIEVHPDNVSNTGTVTGIYANSFFIWTPSLGLKNIGDVTNGNPASGTGSITSDGSKIAMSITNPTTNINEMTLYDVATQTHTYLGDLDANSGGSSTTAYGISSDGKTVVGLGWISGGTAHPVKWSAETGIIDMGSTVAGNSARANAVSADGTVIGGWQDSDMGRVCAVWKNNIQTLVTEETEYGTLPLNEVSDVSDNGVWAVGSSLLGYATIWSEDTGVIKINHPDVSLDTGFSGAATSVNADGSIVVGYFRNLFDGTGSAPDKGEGFIWTPTTGRVELTAYAQSLGIDTQGVTFNLPTGISPNGKYITGWGKKNGSPIGFRLELPDTVMAVNNIDKKIVSIYPNPVKDLLNIAGASIITNVEIYDISGQKVLDVKDMKSRQLNINKLPKGTYLLKGLFDGQKHTLKIIKE
ncbi:putative membrane protein [Epilithonimonas hungarica]|uniref:T9SS type A sorting domain-containing protein n=1 Tax=Epilithonimonas hungarica TaxID=454006 RepID=UPI00278886FE|nr:T9SS type A sorting domain-containing protein [Epilithonimonas hungarica]MDP9957892.1 putative membrane protein [Epilithonimonas hungarica]